jgi:uncharacterized membrane protein
MLSSNPENPYVFNEYFFANVTNLPHEKTTFGLVHHLINYTAFTFGIATVLLVQYLILFKTPRQFQEFSKLLLLCMAVDTFYLLTDLFTQTVSPLNSTSLHVF